MLLSLMRKHAKSWLIKVLIAIIALVFIFYFGYSFTSKESFKIAYVNGDLITVQEYQKTYLGMLEWAQNQYKDVWNDSLIKLLDLKTKALESLVNQKLIAQEAKRLGMEVTESEIRQAIQVYPAFQVNDQFDFRRYRALLSNNRMKPEAFEEGVTLELLDKKIKQFLFVFMGVTDQEALDHYTYMNDKIKISFVQFKPDSFKGQGDIDQALMEEFFKEHEALYRFPPKIKVAYLEIDPEAFNEQADITENEISQYYEYHVDSFAQPKKVRARHILFKLSQDAKKDEEEKVRKEAEAVLEEVRQGKDFVALAKQYSEGPTKLKGGDLGYFPRGQMLKPFEDVAFSLKKGEVSDLVRTRFGYHIIRLEDILEANTQSLEEVRDRIVQALTKDIAMDLAQEKGLSLIDQMPYEVDLRQYGAEHGFKVVLTDYFSQEEVVSGIFKDQKLRQSLFSLDKNDTSELMELAGKYCIFQVVDKKASYLPKMEEVVEQVKEDVADDLAAKKAKEAAESMLAELKKRECWDELAENKGLEIEKTGFFTRKAPISKVGNIPELKETAFGLNKENPYPDSVFENNKGAFIIRWEGKQGIDEKKYQEEKETIRFSVMQTKQRHAFENWLENLRKGADIQILNPL